MSCYWFCDGNSFWIIFSKGLDQYQVRFLKTPEIAYPEPPKSRISSSVEAES